MHILRQKIIWDAKVEMLFVHTFPSMCKCVSETHRFDKGYTKILNVDPISVSGTLNSVSGTPKKACGSPKDS